MNVCQCYEMYFIHVYRIYTLKSVSLTVSLARGVAYGGRMDSAGGRMDGRLGDVADDGRGRGL